MEQHEYHSGDHVMVLLTDHSFVLIAVFDIANCNQKVSAYYLQ